LGRTKPAAAVSRENTLAKEPDVGVELVLVIRQGRKMVCPQQLRANASIKNSAAAYHHLLDP
jgi:hypothetical protein